MNIRINSRIIPFSGRGDSPVIVTVKRMAKHKKKQIMEKKDA